MLRSIAFLALLNLLPLRLVAQAAPPGTVILSVGADMGGPGEALVRVDTLTLTTAPNGTLRFTLPAGRRVLAISRIGFGPQRVSVVVPPGGEVRVDVVLEMEMVEVEELFVSSTRTERLAGETPIRVEVVDEMEVDEKTQMSPSGITMLLNETPGVRVQAASPSLGTGSVRILGLPGQYTAILADGLPLYGGASSAIGPLDISPVDLRQVELIKGAASALYGGQALGGVINLISKPPSGRSELLLNRRTLSVTDGAAWLSRRFSETAGGSLLLSGTLQGREDLDGDGWGDQAEATRWGIRPRFQYADPEGRRVFVTLGYAVDEREGGTMPGAVAPDGDPFAEGLAGRRADIGVSARLPTSEGKHYAIRSALSTNGRDRTFGPGPLETDRMSTGFLEVTRSLSSSKSALVVGVVAQMDRYRNELNDAYDHSWLTPGLFASGEHELGGVVLSASLRGDAHPEAGLQVTERLAALIRPVEGWSLRLSGGTGFAAATANTEETEAIGLRQVRPGAELEPERSWGATVDIGGKIGAVEVLVTGYGSSITDAVQLADAGDASGDGVLRNAAGETRIGGVEFASIWRFAGGKLFLTYGYAQGTETDAVTGAREPAPLIPRHRGGFDLMLEREGVYRYGFEAIVYGTQPLDDDPYRSESKPYVYGMFLAMRQFGSVEVVANFENLFNVRQTDFDPLVRPTATTGGRWTTDVWAPLEGFMANVAVRYRW